MNKLPRIRPEAEGVDPAGILAFVEAADKMGGVHSLMLLRRGKVVAEGWWNPYGPQHPHTLWSLSKSFTSTAVGLAISEGHLSLDDKAVSFFPSDLPKTISANLANMRVRDLLTMSTGHATDTVGAVRSQANGDWVRGFLSLPVELTPGSKFVYNSGATYILSAIVQKVTKKTVLDYLTPRLFAPLGIQNPTWETCPKGINSGGWGLSITTEDIAKFGQLYLQKGKWNGKQLLPESWVADATASHISTGDMTIASDWTQGYCYQFWRCRHNGFRADGAFGQFSVVLPEQEVVLALTCGTNNTQGVLNAVWEHLLPALKPNKLPASPVMSTLTTRLKRLEIATPKGQATSPTLGQVIGKVYLFEKNAQSLQSVELTPTHLILKTGQDKNDKNSEQKIPYKSGGWTKGEMPLGDSPSKRIATRGTWTTPDTLVITACAYETPSTHTITLEFAPNQVTVSRAITASFGPSQLPRLVGRVAV
jgi:CubicO group peptidase (beta-lactamase class C family)